MEINFECKSCHGIFDNEVGQVSINEETMRPDFEKKILCPSCGEKTIDYVLLTELGQSQIAEATWDRNRKREERKKDLRLKAIMVCMQKWLNFSKALELNLYK